MHPAGQSEGLGARPAACPHVVGTRKATSVKPRVKSALPLPRGLVGVAASHQAEGRSSEHGHLDTLDGVEEVSYTLATPEQMAAAEDVQVGRLGGPVE